MGADFKLVNSNLITGAVALLESMLLEIYQNISKLALWSSQIEFARVIHKTS